MCQYPAHTNDPNEDAAQTICLRRFSVYKNM
jgi:hypothetical protein